MYEIDTPRAISNLLELVPVVPKEYEDVVLAAATFLDEYHLTPFDVLYAGVIACSDERVLTSEQDYDTIRRNRIPLEPDSDAESETN